MPTSFNVNAKDANKAHKTPRVLKGDEVEFMFINWHESGIITSLFATRKKFIYTRLFIVKY